MDRKRILIADDEPSILEALTMILEDEGYDIDVTADGRKVAAMLENGPNLILLDIWMTGMDGGAMCKQLKNQETTKHIPIIMLSANRDTKTIAAECGADGYLTKPFDLDQLVSTVARYLNT